MRKGEAEINAGRSAAQKQVEGRWNSKEGNGSCFQIFPLLFLSLWGCHAGTARGADGLSVIQRGMFHVHLAQAQIPPAGKLFSGQPPVIRGLGSTAKNSIALFIFLRFQSSS